MGKFRLKSLEGYLDTTLEQSIEESLAESLEEFPVLILVKFLEESPEIPRFSINTWSNMEEFPKDYLEESLDESSLDAFLQESLEKFLGKFSEEILDKFPTVLIKRVLVLQFFRKIRKH